MDRGATTASKVSGGEANEGLRMPVNSVIKHAWFQSILTREGIVSMAVIDHSLQNLRAIDCQSQMHNVLTYNKRTTTTTTTTRFNDLEPRDQQSNTQPRLPNLLHNTMFHVCTFHVCTLAVQNLITCFGCDVDELLVIPVQINCKLID